jgi:hypothetical protein
LIGYALRRSCSSVFLDIVSEKPEMPIYVPQVSRPSGIEMPSVIDCQGQTSDGREGRAFKLVRNN